MRISLDKNKIYKIEKNGATFLMRRLTATELQGIQDENLKWNYDDQGNRQVQQPGLTHLKNNKSAFIKYLNAWENFEDENGNPIPCTDLSKDQLYELDPDFCLGLIEDLRKKSRNQEAQEQKNLQPGSNLEPTKSDPKAEGSGNISIVTNAEPSTKKNVK